MEYYVDNISVFLRCSRNVVGDTVAVAEEFAHLDRRERDFTFVLQAFPSLLDLTILRLSVLDHQVRISAVLPKF